MPTIQMLLQRNRLLALQGIHAQRNGRFLLSTGYDTWGIFVPTNARWPEAAHPGTFPLPMVSAKIALPGSRKP